MRAKFNNAEVAALNTETLPGALRTLSGVAGGSIHLPTAFSMAQISRRVVAGKWLMPLAKD
jgi:hypothetical protein